MNIILFTSSTNKSGGSRQALYLAQGLSQRGHNVIFFIPETSSLREIAPNYQGFADLGPKHLWRKNIEAAMPSDGSPCLVHAFHNAAVKKAALWSLFWGKKVVTVAHRGVIFRPNNPLPYWSWGIAHFIVNSDVCAQTLRKIGVSRQRLSVVPNAVPDERLFARCSRMFMREGLKLDPDAFLFGIVANNNPIKGVQQAIEAFSSKISSRFPQARLLIVGIRPALWQPLCTKLGVQEKIFLQPPTEDVASFYQAMDAFVLPSLSESMPNTLLEAVRMGLPCIGTKVGAVPQILDKCGLCVDPDDVSSLGAGMVRFLKDPELRRRLREAAKQEAVRYTPAVRLNAIETLYRMLLCKRGLQL